LYHAVDYYANSKSSCSDALTHIINST
jgi:hypothetical protein